MSEVKRYGSAVFDSGLIEMSCGDYVTYSDYQKLVAENAAMRKAVDETIGWQESVDASNTESVRLLVVLQTPATDDAIAEIKAQGADTVAEYHKVRADALCDVDMKGMHRHQLANMDARDVAANLRAGRKG